MTAFVDVAVIPMDTERVLERQTVLVRGGRIRALGPSAGVKVPAGATRIDGRGKYLMPGLGDCHAHIGFSWGSAVYDSMAERRLFLWLADGVTTIRNMDYTGSHLNLGFGSFMVRGGDLLRLKARAAAGELWSPRIYTAGQWAPDHYIVPPNVLKQHASRPAPRLDSVAAYVAAYKAAGYDFIKLHFELPDMFAAVLAAARQVGIPVTGHLPSGPGAMPPEQALAQALAGGMRSIEHLDGYLDGYVAPQFAASDTSTVAFRTIAAATQRAGVWNCPTTGVLRISAGSKSRPWRTRLIRALQDAGAGLLLGTDVRSVHAELEELVNAGGLRPYEALAAGTRNMAMYFDALDESGTVETGKRADLVLLDGNPLQDIRNTRRPAVVMIGGRWLARDELDRRVAAVNAAGGAGVMPD